MRRQAFGQAASAQAAARRSIHGARDVEIALASNRSTNARPGSRGSSPPRTRSEAPGPAIGAILQRRPNFSCMPLGKIGDVGQHARRCQASPDLAVVVVKDLQRLRRPRRWKRQTCTDRRALRARTTRVPPVPILQAVILRRRGPGLACKRRACWPTSPIFPTKHARKIRPAPAGWRQWPARGLRHRVRGGELPRLPRSRVLSNDSMPTAISTSRAPRTTTTPLRLGRRQPDRGLRRIRAKMLIVSFDSDWLIPPMSAKSWPWP